MAEALDQSGKGEKVKMRGGHSEEEDKMRDEYREEEDEEEEEGDDMEQLREKELTGRQDGWFVPFKTLIQIWVLVQVGLLSEKLW